MNTPFSIDEVSFRDLPGWGQDDPRKLAFSGDGNDPVASS